MIIRFKNTSVRYFSGTSESIEPFLNLDISFENTHESAPLDLLSGRTRVNSRVESYLEKNGCTDGKKKNYLLKLSKQDFAQFLSTIMVDDNTILLDDYTKNNAKFYQQLINEKVALEENYLELRKKLFRKTFSPILESSVLEHYRRNFDPQLIHFCAKNTWIAEKADNNLPNFINKLICKPTLNLKECTKEFNSLSKIHAQKLTIVENQYTQSFYQTQLQCLSDLEKATDEKSVIKNLATISKKSKVIGGSVVAALTTLQAFEFGNDKLSDLIEQVPPSFKEKLVKFSKNINYMDKSDLTDL